MDYLTPNDFMDGESIKLPKVLGKELRPGMMFAKYRHTAVWVVSSIDNEIPVVLFFDERKYIFLTAIGFLPNCLSLDIKRIQVESEEYYILLNDIQDESVTCFSSKTC